MDVRDMEIGFLTLATRSDYLKAIGLSLSLKKSNPGIPSAVACAKDIQPILSRYFDYVIEEDAQLIGFEHKVNLDVYSPFDHTLFIDADVLVFRDLRSIFDQWGHLSYTARGGYAEGGYSSFGLGREYILDKLNKKSLVVIGGAGHGLFRKPECAQVFNYAREITKSYEQYSNGAKYSDEDAMGITMTRFGLQPISMPDLVGIPRHAISGSLSMDVLHGHCEYRNYDGLLVRPYMMHFIRNSAPFVYYAQLSKLFGHFNIQESGLLRQSLYDWLKVNVEWAAKSRLKKIFSWVSK